MSLWKLFLHRFKTALASSKPEVVGMAEDDQTESDKIDIRSVKHVSSTGKLKLATAGKTRHAEAHQRAVDTEKLLNPPTKVEVDW